MAELIGLTPEEEMQRAERARQILDDDLFKEAVAAMDAALLSGMQRAAFKDEKLREKLCQRYALLHDLLDQLRGYMEGGRLAEATIAQRIRNVIGI